ncbi:MAG TPA: LCCL domain-containing protein, partial [Gemmataceae bacterium]|nr:LCCL domain-containing protein [Gemmataceae bacterium]
FSERGDYENFHLRVEAIVTEPGVFGIYYRSGFRFVGDTAESRHPPGYVAGFPVDDPVRIQQFREFFKPNEWFTLEVVADGSHRIEKYNGKTILDVVDKEPAFRKGHIVLRQLNNDSATFFRKIEIEELPASPPAPAPVLPDPGTAANLREQVGKTLSFQLVGSADGPIWGTDVYTADSRLATAAVHAGVLKVGQRGVVRVTVLPGMDLYQGKERHGVISNSYGSYPVSIRIDGATDASDAPPFVVLARPGKLERSFASFDELIAASDENDHFALRGLPDDPANEQVKKLRKELMEEYRVHYPARAGRVAAMLLALLGEVSPSVDQLQGTWKAVGCEAGGEKFHGAKFLPSQMDVRVTFTGTCVRYQWKLPKNLAAYKDELKPEFDGEFSVNVKAEPKRIAMLVLGEAKNSMIGSYRLEGNRLTVHWLPNPKDLNYPTSFETKAGDAAVVLVFERVTPPQTRTWWQVNYAEYDGKQFPDDEIKEWRVVTGGANRDRYIHVGFPEAQAGTFKLDVTKPIRPGVFPVDYAVTDGPHRGKTILGIWEYYGETMRICTAAPGNRNRPTLFLTSQGSGGWILVMKQFPLGRTNPTQEFGPPPRIVNDPPSKE